MPGFADSFWSNDYAAGLGVLFGKLQQGIVENRQILTVSRMRAEAEEIYGQRLGDIPVTVDKVQGGFATDDGASTRKAYEGVRTEMEDASRIHRKIAQNIRDLVVNPFSRWCEAHEVRVQDSQDELQSRIKAHDRQAVLVRKLRSTYFNKSRLVEDFEEENKFAFQSPEAVVSPKRNSSSSNGTNNSVIPQIKVEEEQEAGADAEKKSPENANNEDEEPFEIGDEFYPPDQVKKMLAHILNTVPLGETRVPILGTYQNTTAGTDIVEYLQQNMNASSVSYAERIGQDLVTCGFLRLVGNVGSTFANSSRLFYQWRPKAFQMSGVPDKRSVPLSRTFSLPVGASGSEAGSNGSVAADSPVIGTVNEYLEKWNVLGNSHPNETPVERMQREAQEADERYKAGVRKLDALRCDLEEAIFDHLRFLERCELDRLKAVKTVLLDFSGTIGNVIPSLQSTVDKVMLYQEAVQPLGDLRYLLENYRTGSFIPRVVTYENYYNRVDEETFGVDLEARARADKKRVPVLVTTLLTYLDHHYPDLEGDEARRNVWLVDVPLQKTHKLRAKINHGKSFGMDVLDEFDIPTIASLLKLYLRELPDSLVSSHVYEIIRTIYQSPASVGDGSADEDARRVPVLQQTLSQLRLTNIATLDACMNHFTRLIDLTSADEKYVAALATTLAPCILRPRVESSLTMEERHGYRLVRDLFAHKDPIFRELKRLSAMTHSSVGGSHRQEREREPNQDRDGSAQQQHQRFSSLGAGSAGGGSEAAGSGTGSYNGLSAGSGSLSGRNSRPRAISTDESNRRVHMEERNRLILEKASGSRSRATSPAPSPRASTHRRDRSIGGPETRFPIQTSSPTAAATAGAAGGAAGSAHFQRPSVAMRGGKRQSLEVPGEEGAPSSTSNTSSASNTGASPAVSGSHGSSNSEEAVPGSGSPLTKRSSINRASVRFENGRRITPGIPSSPRAGNLASAAPVSHGVTLVDRPMD